jgi:putative heme-binding domain-containing protein
MTKALLLLLSLILADPSAYRALLAGPGLQQAAAPPVSPGARFQVPPGFVVETAADAERTGSVVAITFDSRGRPVLSREKGPVYILEDRDKDGVFETFLTFTETVTNCQGLYFLGNDLLAVGDGPSGTALYRIYDRNGDSVGDETVTLTRFSGGMGEHGPHSIFLGPDGLLYVDLGNHSGIAPTPSPRSAYQNYEEGQLLPVYYDPRGHARQIRAPGGTIFRIDQDAKNWEMFAGGFRNHYDSAFNEFGELFTWDSDMEWDIDLPWYRPLRTVHIVPGGEYGWRTGSGVWPDYFIDNLPPMAEQGRGSPVGVEFYLHQVYPKKYHNAFILGDWSRGRILMSFLRKEGATYRAVEEDFVLGEPINVTDLEVGPDGFLYFATGGRSTEGGLYRVAYRDSAAQKKPQTTGINAALEQPQHRSAWGRARIKEIQRELGPRWSRDLEATLNDKQTAAPRRVRALELLQVYGPQPSFERLLQLGKDQNWEVRAASAYYLGLHATPQSRRELALHLADTEPFVRRRVLEALVRARIEPSLEAEFDVAKHLVPLLGDPDRWVRFAAVKTLQRTNRNLWREAVLQETRPLPAIEGMLAMVQTARGTNDIDPLLRKELEFIKGELEPEDLLRLLRVVHLTFVHDEGVERVQLYQEIGRRLLERFPSRDMRINREIARTLAHLQTPGAIGKILEELAREDSSRLDQIFYAYCLRNLRAGWTEDQQKTMVRWFAKTQVEKWRGGASFVGYLENIWKSWLGNLPYNDQGRATTLLASLAPPPTLSEGKPATSFTRRSDVSVLSDQELAEYLVWDPMAYKPSPADGSALYQKARCANCHLFNGLGYEAGPDLSDIGKRFRRKDLVEATLFPNKTISDLWAAVEITTTDGESHVGTILSQDPQEVVLNQIGGKITIPTNKIRSRVMSKRSFMPEGLLDNLSLREAVALMQFLEKGGRKTDQ